MKFLTFTDAVPIWRQELKLPRFDEFKQLCLVAIRTPERRKTTKQDVGNDSNCPHVHLNTISWKNNDKYYLQCHMLGPVIPLYIEAIVGTQLSGATTERVLQSIVSRDENRIARNHCAWILWMKALTSLLQDFWSHIRWSATNCRYGSGYFHGQTEIRKFQMRWSVPTSNNLWILEFDLK